MPSPSAPGGGRVCLHGTQHVINCVPGQTLLASALAAGLDLPYECASGSCGSCRARLLEGQVASLWPTAPGLSERDRAKGDRILCCQSLPQGECRVQIRLGEEEVHSPPRRLRARVQSLRLLNKDVVYVELQPQGSMPVSFRAGQFMLVDWPDGIGRRAYSMANPPSDGDCLTFIIKRKPGGAGSARLFGQVREGDVLDLEGPYGRAWLRAPEAIGEPLVLLAGGSGLAPMWSIAQTALREQPARSVRLYFGVQRVRDLFWVEEMRRLAETMPSFVPVLAVAESDARLPADCRLGPVGEVLAADLSTKVGHDLYMAGPPGLIDHVHALLVQSGRLRADRIFYDRFA